MFIPFNMSEHAQITLIQSITIIDLEYILTIKIINIILVKIVCWQDLFNYNCLFFERSDKQTISIQALHFQFGTIGTAVLDEEEKICLVDCGIQPIAGYNTVLDVRNDLPTLCIDVVLQNSKKNL